MTANDSRLARFLSLLHPRGWPVWLLLCPLSFLLAWLPWPLQRVLGNGLGNLSWLLMPARRHITRRNLELCFPDWTPARREQVARDSFRNTGIAVFESSMAWWRTPQTLAARTRISGLDALQAAAAQGRGVLLLGAHYTTLEWVGAAVSAHLRVDTIYRPQNNTAMETFVFWRRRRIYRRQLDRFDVRAIFRAFKEGDVVWYTGDQDFGRKHAVFIPFFGVTAAVVTAGSRFARVNNSPVFSVAFRRDDDGGYSCEFRPVPGFPSGDETRDALLLTQTVEAGIRQAPGQYMWYHKRFKTRPQRGDPSLYGK